MSARTNAMEGRDTSEASDTRGARILLAEDNPEVREYLTRLLSPHWAVQAVNDGAEALAVISDGPPELVLTDVMMPVLDGFGLLKRLRADPRLKEIPVIVLSARTGIESSVEGLNAGADDYLIKPFSARELTARVQTHLRQARVRKEAKDVLARRTAQYETLVNEAPLGIFLIGGDFRFRRLNPTAAGVFATVPDIIGRHLEEVISMLWLKADADQILLRFRATMDTGVPYYNGQLMARRCDQDVPEFYEWQVNRIPLPEGGLGVVCYFRDISEQLRARAEAHAADRLRIMADALRTDNASLEREVAERTRELVDANADMESFCFSVAHDLRAPLRSIEGFSRIVLEGYADNVSSEGKGYLLRVEAAGVRMGQLIDGLLVLARLSRKELVSEEVDLSGQAQEIASDLRRTEPDRDCEVVIAPAMVATGDAAMLRVVLQNLMDNAWKFTGKTAGARIEVGVRRDQQPPTYFVQDNGAGFEMKSAARMFGNMTRFHSESEFPGTGIGLATVRRIIQRHGGRVWAEAEPKKGATFFFTLPTAGQ